jgi:hypothetical protein
MLFRIPWPWDYHGSGALIVEAPNQEVAVRRAHKYLAEKYPEREYAYKDASKVEWAGIEKVDGYVTQDNGCDC